VYVSVQEEEIKKQIPLYNSIGYNKYIMYINMAYMWTHLSLEFTDGIVAHFADAVV